MADKDTAKLNFEQTAISTEILLFFKTPFTIAPSSKPVDFDQIIGGSLHQEARSLLKLATTQRAKLLDILGDSKADVRNVIAAVDAYLPSIWRITASMQASSDSSIKLNRKLEFKWTSALSKSKKEFLGTVLLFETAFVLAIRAIAHRDGAKQCWETGNKSYSDVGRELRIGAGIFEFIGKDLIARWVHPPEHRPPELNQLVHSCLTACFLADAQRVAIGKALEDGASPSTIAKLLIGCADKYDFAARCLQSCDKETFDSIIPGLLEELGAYPAILRGCASNCLAQTEWAKGEYSKGLAWAIDGSRRLSIINMGKGLKESKLQEYVNSAARRASLLEANYEKDCSQVYFVKPAKENRMIDGKFIVNAIPYELPVEELISFAEVGLSAAQAKMPIQNFWSSLWAKPVDYPKSADESVAAAAAVSGAASTFMEGEVAVAAMSKLNLKLHKEWILLFLMHFLKIFKKKFFKIIKLLRRKKTFKCKYM